MSLSIAIDQIQRPTWWFEGARIAAKKEASIEVLECRQKLLDYLLATGKKISGRDLQKHFDWTNARFWFYATPLVEDGLIIKYKIRHDACLLEASSKAKNEARKDGE